MLKRSRDDSNKDQDLSAGSDRGSKRKKSSKEAESSKDSRSKEKKSSRTSKDASQSQHKSSGKSAHAEEPSHIVDDSGVQQDQEFDTGNNDKQPTDKEVSKDDWFKKPERPPTPDFDWNKRQHVDSRPPQTWIMSIHNPEGKPYPFDLSKPLPLIRDHRGRQVIPQDFFINNNLEYLKDGDLSRQYSTSVTKTKAATYEIKWIEDLVRNLWSPVKVIYDKHAYWGISHWGPKRQHFYGFAANMSSSKDVYSTKRIIGVTRLTIMNKYDYGHLEEIEVRREDQKLYKFREGDFLQLRLQDIEDILLLLIDIQRLVEDLQLGVESYQKMLNLTKPDTFKSNLRNRTTYTAYSDPKGVIYKDQMNKNRLMRADELHKFSDGTLDDVRFALNDIAKGIRMEYLSKRKWSGLDKQQPRVMIQDIDKQLYERRLLRNLEKFVGGREYGNDLRLLERTI
ncbi:hypothetical protein Tco_0899988 [Tanacetum coccineum]